MKFGMKKFGTAIAASVFCLTTLSAQAFDLRPFNRYFELGVAVDASVSNNVMGLKDLLVNTIVIDTAALGKIFDGNGMNINVVVDSPLFFMNINSKKGFHLGLDVGVDANVDMKLKTNLIGGNSNSGDIQVGGSLLADAFVYTKLDVAFKVNENIRVSVAPTVFVPVLHVDTNDISAKMQTGSTISANAQGVAQFYSEFVNINDIMSGAGFAFDVNTMLNALKSSMGFDLSVAAELPLPAYERLQLGGYARIPIMPATMKSGIGYKLDWNIPPFTMGDVLQGNMPTISAPSLTTLNNLPTLKISRPLRVGAEVAWRPFGQWFTVSGLVGIGIRYPFTKMAKFYPEYSAQVAVSLARMLGASFTTAYLGQQFQQKLGIVMNLHFIELDLIVGMKSSSFVKSFTGSGLEAGVFVSLGVPRLKTTNKAKNSTTKKKVADDYMVIE